MSERTVRAKLLVDTKDAVANVDKLGSKIKETADQSQKSSKSTQQGFDDFAGTLTKVGATAAVGVGLAVKKFADFDKQMSSVQAATHETAGNMDLLREAAIQAGADTAFSATEAAEGIEALAKAGVNTQEILGGGLKGALDLAAAGNLGVGDSAEVAATAMTQFNLTGKEVPHIADLLAAGAGKAQGEVSDMAAALKQSGLVASQFGLSIEDTTGTLAAFASAGLIGSDAGTSFKTMLIALANPSKESADLMKQLGINAYDAQGAFIGIAPLASQLQDRLKGLTQEQRNAALAQIFGTDAVRAANVLYEQGAQGITDWTTKVNDTGFAAETARTKLDNLSGDVETLGGSFETALIKSGSGANDVLRLLVQTATGAVNLFGDLPGPIQGTVTALGGVVAIGGLAAAALLKGVEGAKGLQAQWTGLSRTGKTLTLSMGGVGLALTAAAAVYGVFAKRNEEAKQRAEDLRSTLDEQTGAITKNTQAYVANKLASDGTLEKAKEFGLSLTDVTAAALGNTAAMDAVTTSLDRVINQNAQLSNGEVSGELIVQSKSAEDLKNKIVGMSDGLSEAQKQQKLMGEATQGATGATAEQATAAGRAATANQQQAQASETAAAAAAKQEQALNDLINTMNRMPGLVLSLRDAQRGWFESVEAASAALKENGKTLDITTPKGRANQEALDAMAKSANDVTESMIRNGQSNRNVVATYEQNRAGLVKVAQQFGLNRQQAIAYADKVLAIPKRTNTDIKANISDLEAKLKTAKGQLADKNLTKARRAEIQANIADLTSKLATARGQLANLPSSKTVTITTRMIQERIVRTQTTSGGGHAPTNAEGGQIGGWSPHPKADNLLSWVTAGEWVHSNAAVDYYGPTFMRDVNNRTFPKPRGYADGGEVGGLAAGWSGINAPIFMPAPVTTVTNISVPIEVGGEVTRVVTQQIRSSNATLKRNVYHQRGR